MFRQVRFECEACGEGFVDWHDDEWERSPVFCVHCGVPIVAGAPIGENEAPPRAPRNPKANTALGVLRGNGRPFPDTLRGLRIRQPSDADSEPESQRDTAGPERARHDSARAQSESPDAALQVPSARRRKHWASTPLAALLAGFALGVPLALLAEEPVSRWLFPAAAAQASLTQRLALISDAIDGGHWEQARTALDADPLRASNDVRVATLRARLALGLILARRSAEAERELSLMKALPPSHPTLEELQRVSQGLSVASAAPASASAPAIASSNALEPAKPVVTRRELLSFAHDRVHRSQLDLAQQLYEAVLQRHPRDAEARCGLAEIQILRGGVADGAQLFERALHDNPGYVPAWLGLADIDWLNGNPGRAACRYQAIIDRFPASSYPPYIVHRVEQVLASGAHLPEAGSRADAVNACP